MAVSYREAALKPVYFQYWEQDRKTEIARQLVAGHGSGSRPLNFDSIYFRELRDAVDRGAEQLATRADEDLDHYWNARRGIPTYYAPLLLGVRHKSYLKSASLECVGEGLALHVLEDRTKHPDLFGLELYCRPLGATPDLMMYYRRDPSRLALVEAKATEDDNLTGSLVLAVKQLMNVLQAWQNHRDLRTTDGFAVAASVFTPGAFKISILKLTRCI